MSPRPESLFLTPEEKRDPIGALASLLARQVVVDHSSGERRPAEERPTPEPRRATETS